MNTSEYIQKRNHMWTQANIHDIVLVKEVKQDEYRSIQVSKGGLFVNTVTQVNVVSMCLPFHGSLQWQISTAGWA